MTMTMAIFALSVFLGVLSIFNKILLFIERKSGWTSGMVIGVLSAVYFYLIDLRILAVAEVGFFVVMLHGYIRQVKPSKQNALLISVVLSAISVLLCYALFVGYITAVETVASLSFIWGGYQLATGGKAPGWVLLLVAHVTTSIASFYAQQTVFAALQTLSAAVCVYALFYTLLKGGEDGRAEPA
jgi:hypothetical protein